MLALTLLTFATGWRLTGSVVAGFIAALWTLTMPQILDVMTHALTESLYIPLSMAALLLCIIYTQRQQETLDTKSYVLLGLLAFVLSWVPMTRAFGLGLVGAVCGALCLRSLLARRWRRFWLEVLVGVVAVLPMALSFVASYFLNGCAYCGVTPDRIDLSTVAVSRGWIARLMVTDFIPAINLGFGLRGLVRNPLSLALVGLAGLGMGGLLAFGLWRNRAGLRATVQNTVGWARLPIWLYIAAYLVFIFGTSTPGVYVSFNYPRYLVPLYPFYILLVVALLSDLFKLVPAWAVRGVLAVAVLLYGLGISQAANVFVQRAAHGRGIEAAETRNHPALAYLRQQLRPTDVIFSTKAPTVWFYTDHPSHRLDGVDKLTCNQLTTPAPNTDGRSVFVLFPFYVFKGNPTEPANLAWFKDWADDCGTSPSPKLSKMPPCLLWSQKKP
ncbi:MAG: hypothetical protein HC853_15395 [Anaerolineae bacterium]|nr:hypothetical protein [Anaerolineae bacterium]